MGRNEQEGLGVSNAGCGGTLEYGDMSWRRGEV